MRTRQDCSLHPVRYLSQSIITYTFVLDNFVYILRNVFLNQPQYSKYTRDIVFDNDGIRLDASRIPVHLRYVGATNQSRAMNLFRRLAETSELPTGVYADFFQFAEQYNAVLPGTLSSIAIAGAAVILVSLVLIPEPIASFWVSLSIISINVGILGFMVRVLFCLRISYCILQTFWSVRLDFISMVTIVMSIGFCVDFAAHLAYNYAKVCYCHCCIYMRYVCSGFVVEFIGTCS